MKFVCKSGTLKTEIDMAASVANLKNSISITSNVLLEAGNDLLTIKTTDQKMGFSSSIPVSVSVMGSTTVFCDKLAAVLKSIPDIDIEISDDNGILSIVPNSRTENDFCINIKTIDASKFPELSYIDDDNYFSVTQRDFFDMIDKTSFAVAEDDTRHFLQGVYMEYKNDRLVMVATDGKRLACVRREFEQEIPDNISAIMPVRFLNLLKNIGTGEGVLSIAVREGEIFARAGERTIYSSLISGTYPNYEKVIPQGLENSVIVKTSEFEKALSLISILVENKSKRVFITLKENTLTISGEDTDFGDSRQSIGCSYDGQEIVMTFNCALLQTSLKRMNSDFFRILFRTSSSAMIFSPEPEKDYLFVLMPMQV